MIPCAPALASTEPSSHPRRQLCWHCIRIHWSSTLSTPPPLPPPPLQHCVAAAALAGFQPASPALSLPWHRAGVNSPSPCPTPPLSLQLPFSPQARAPHPLRRSSCRRCQALMFTNVHLSSHTPKPSRPLHFLFTPLSLDVRTPSFMFHVVLCFNSMSTQSPPKLIC